MKTVLTSQIPWKGLRYAQGFANRAVTNVGNTFKKFACKGKKRWWIAMSCRIRRAFQPLLDRVLASLGHVSKLLWLSQLITNALFGAELSQQAIGELLISELSSFKWRFLRLNQEGQCSCSFIFYLFIFLKKLFIYGCAGSSFLCEDLL